MADFFAAWSLFGDAWTVALLLAALLPCCGIVLVLRQQVFLSAAIGQASTLGIAVGIWCGLAPAALPGGSHTETLALLLAVGSGVATAVLAMRALSTSGSQIEARSAAIFVTGSALSVLLGSTDPHGLEEVRRLTLSSLLGVSGLDLWLAGTALAATALALGLAGRSVLLWAMDPGTARAHGANVPLLDVLVGGWIGACTGFAIHATGLLFAFGLSLLPVLIARELAASLRAALWLAPAVGVLGTTTGLVVAHRLDLPPGQMAVGLLAIGLPLAVAVGAGWRRVRRLTGG